MELRCRSCQVAVRGCAPIDIVRSFVKYDVTATQRCSTDEWFDNFVFALGVLQRCTNKDVSAEHRALCSSLVAETLTVLQQPAFPAAAIFLEQIVLSVVKQLGLEGGASSTGAANANSSAKRDTTYTAYLVDILGTVCVVVRGIMLTAEREEKAALSFRLSPEVEECLSRKVGELKHDWLQVAAKAHSSSAVSTAVSGTKKTVKSCSRAPPSAAAPALDVATALSALLQVTASTVDALLEQPQNRQGDGTPAGAEEQGYSTALSSLPPPVLILQQLPQHADVLRYVHYCGMLTYSVTRVQISY
jgi:hypothetical protein